MAGLFITATGTGVGKTLVTALLARQLRAAGQAPRLLKPVLSGFDPALAGQSDAGVLLAALGRSASGAEIDRISPWRFAAPLSPDMAAAREGRDISFDALLSFCQAEIAAAKGPLLIEGVGGAMVPLDMRHTVLDWMAALALPSVIVSGTYLGSISHTLTTLAAMRQENLVVRAIILSASEESPVAPQDTAATLARFTEVPILIVPRLAIGPDGVPAVEGAPDLTALAV